MSQSLMSGALLHFQSGVPIKDLDMRREHKDRLARVAHVYWVWIKDPMLDAYQMLRQLVKQTGSYSDAAARQPSPWRHGRTRCCSTSLSTTYSRARAGRTS